MRRSLKSFHRTLMTGGGLLLAVALVVAAGVIPPVKADTFPAALPEKAAAAFWVNVALNIIAAAAVSLIALRATGRSRLSTTVLSLLGFLALLLGLALTDAAFAFRAHGPAMQTASTLLFLCSAGDLVAGVLVIATAFLPPKRT